MKKLFLMITLVMGISLMSCQGNATADATKTGDSTAVEEQVVEKKVDINELLAKAKAEGANWSVDEWKAAFKEVLIALKPMLDFMKDFKEKLEKDPAAAAALMEDEQKTKELESYEKLMEEFTDAANATDNGKKVFNDEEWAKQTLKELGYPEDVMK